MRLSNIKVKKLKIIQNKKGDLLKYLSKEDNFYSKFGECYFNEIKKNKTKGWICHKRNQCLLSVPLGKVEFTFSVNLKGKKRKILLGRNSHSIIILPPKIWFKFKSLDKLSLVINTLNNPHEDKEVLKLPI